MLSTQKNRNSSQARVGSITESVEPTWQPLKKPAPITFEARESHLLPAGRSLHAVDISKMAGEPVGHLSKPERPGLLSLVKWFTQVRVLLKVAAPGLFFAHFFHVKFHGRIM